MNLQTVQKGHVTGLAGLGVISLALLMSVGLIARAADHNEEIYYDGFESGNASEWSSNQGWDISDEDASEGTYKAFSSETVEGEGNALVATTSTAGYEEIELMFDYMAMSLEADDEIRVQVRTDDAWEDVLVLTEDDEVSDWTTKTVPLETGADDNDSFAFRFLTDFNSETDEFHLDEVYLRGMDEDAEDDDDIHEDLRDVIEQILVSYEDGGSDIEVHMDLDAENRDDVVETLAHLLGLSESDIEDLIKDDEDDDDNDNGNGDNGNDDGDKDDDDPVTEGKGVEDLQAIYVYVWDSTTGVELDFDYTFEWLSFDTTDRDEIVERTAEYLDADEDDVEELMVFEE